MKALSVTQPWAKLIALGVKRIETRSWGERIGYRGALAIHAPKAFPQAARNLCLEEPYRSLLRAAGYSDGDHDWFERSRVLCQVELLDCLLLTPYVLATLQGALRRREPGEDLVEVDLPRGPMRGGPRPFHMNRHELQLGNFTLGRWLWLLGPPVLFRPPVTARGALGLWEWRPPRNP